MTYIIYAFTLYRSNNEFDILYMSLCIHDAQAGSTNVRLGAHYSYGEDAQAGSTIRPFRVRLRGRGEVRKGSIEVTKERGTNREVRLLGLIMA